MGKVYGYDIYESNVVPAEHSLHGFNWQELEHQLCPMGYFVIKRPLASDTELKKNSTP